MSDIPELENAFEFLPGRLYYMAVKTTPNPNPQFHYFTIDLERTLQYWNFFLDFGPLNLGQLYRFCLLLNEKLKSPKLSQKIIVLYSSEHPHRRANAAFLISAWAMLCLKDLTPEDAFRPFRPVAASFPPWHDATQGVCTFNLNILDTLKGLQKARECGFFNFDRFPIEEYEYYEKVENGDLNWVLEGKFIAFAGPHAASTVEANNNGGYQHLTPEHYVPYFQHRNVTLVVRLNKKYYDSRSFTNNDIDHLELYFLDGSNPPDHLLHKFLTHCEDTPGAVAVHCKAGLGRTGSCIGCYMMKHYRFTAEETIGWLRIARPGSVIGPQQQWLKHMQQRMWHDGEIYRARLKPILLPPPVDNDDNNNGSNNNSSNKDGNMTIFQRTLSEKDHMLKSGGSNSTNQLPVLSLSAKMALLGMNDNLNNNTNADEIIVKSARESIEGALRERENSRDSNSIHSSLNSNSNSLRTSPKLVRVVTGNNNNAGSSSLRNTPNTSSRGRSESHSATTTTTSTTVSREKLVKALDFDKAIAASLTTTSTTTTTTTATTNGSLSLLNPDEQQQQQARPSSGRLRSGTGSNAHNNSNNSNGFQPENEGQTQGDYLVARRLQQQQQQQQQQTDASTPSSQQQRVLSKQSSLNNNNNSSNMSSPKTPHHKTVSSSPNSNNSNGNSNSHHHHQSNAKERDNNSFHSGNSSTLTSITMLSKHRIVTDNNDNNNNNNKTSDNSSNGNNSGSNSKETTPKSKSRFRNFLSNAFHL